MNTFHVTITDLDLFLDELRHRGPNLEPVVRVEWANAGAHAFMPVQIRATYLRAYGDRCGVVEFLGYLGTWFSFPGFGPTDDEVARKEAEARRRFDESCTMRYDNYVEQIRAVANEIAVGIAGGRVSANVEVAR